MTNDSTTDPRMFIVPASATDWTFDKPEPVFVEQFEHHGICFTVSRHDFPFHRIDEPLEDGPSISAVGADAWREWRRTAPKASVWYRTSGPHFTVTRDHDGATYRGWTDTSAAKAVKRVRHDYDVRVADNSVRPVAIDALNTFGDPEAWADTIEGSPETLIPGQIVGIYSRGKVRPAVVEKIGKTNATCAYTTRGAIDEMIRLGNNPADTALITRKSAKFADIVVPVLKATFIERDEPAS